MIIQRPHYTWIRWRKGGLTRQHIAAAGFTLIETVVAFGMLMAALSGPVALVAYSVARNQVTHNKLAALNLGQEGIELIREMRENNVLCRIAWNDNPGGGMKVGIGGGPNVVYQVDASDFVDITGSCSGIGFMNVLSPRVTRTTVAGCEAAPLNRDVNGFFTYGAGTTTIYTRCLSICVPPSSQPCSSSNDSDIMPTDHMDVIVSVKWKQFGKPNEVVLRQRLYDWP